MIERSLVRVPAGEFSSSWSSFCADSYVGISVLLQKHVKDPGHCAKGADVRLQIKNISNQMTL